jgi:sarcosine oxidase subunit beta
VATPVVVNAAGPWAAPVAALAGLSVPVRPARRQAALTAPTTGLPASAPLTIDLGSGAYARPAPDGRLVIGGGDRDVTSDLPDDVVDQIGLARTRHLVGARFPGLAEVAIERAWVGLREMSPDDHAILGSTSVEGFLCACGFSGHGLMHAPAAGHLLAELIVDGAVHSLDITPLSPARFARGDLVHESVVF